MRRALVVGGLLALAACAKGGALGEGLIVPPAQDGGAPVSHDKDNHTANDPYAHRGKMDQVLLRPDGTLEVRFYDLHNSPPTGFYYETREITSMLYDHFQHPGNLYIGSNHGVTRIIPARWRLPQTSQEKAWPESVEREWFADHVHPMVCRGGSWLQALPDGRLVLGFPTSGLLVWKPGDSRGHRLTVSDGLPGENIRRMQQDLMHDPPLLLVPTEGGLAVFRQVP